MQVARGQAAFKLSIYFLHSFFTIQPYTGSEKINYLFFKKLARQARLNFSLDSLLFVAFFLASLSGLVAWLVLPSGGYQGGRNPYYNASLLGLTRHGWNDLHLYAGLAMIAVFAVHLALHWNWLVCVARRHAQAAVCNWQHREPSSECAV